MAEAWQVREFQQQELMNRIVEDAHCAAPDDDSDTFFLSLAAALTGSLVARRSKVQDGSASFQFCPNDNDRLAQSYAGRFTRTIKEFSRTSEEEASLIGRLLVKLATLGLSRIDSEYQSQSLHEPQRLYDGHGRMDEVPFFEEE